MFKPNLILLSLVIIGFLLRIIGTSPGYYAHGYEVMYGQAVQMILNKTIGLDYNNLAYPPLVAWIMAVSFLFFFIPLAWIGYFINHFTQVNQLLDPTYLDKIFREEILGKRYWENAMYWGRYITALFGTGSIVLIYKVVIKYFKKRTMAIIASLMLAINYRLVLNSHMGFHDIYNVFFVLLALLGVGFLINKPTPRTYLLAAIFASLAFLIKYQPSGFVALGVAHIIISAKKSKRKLTLFIKNLFKKEVFSAALVGLTIILVSHIDYFLRLDEVLSYAPSVVWSANKFGKNTFYIYPISYIYHVGLGKVLSIFALGGIIIGIALKKYRQQTLIIGSVILTSFYLFAYFSIAGYYTYNLLVPISILIIFCSLFIEILREWFTKNRPKSQQVLAVALYGVVLAYTLKDHLINSFVSTYILAQPSYRLTSQDWIDKNIKGPAVFGSYSSNPAPQKDDIKLTQLSPMQEGFGFEEFVQENLDYALIDFYKIHEKLLWWRIPPPFTPMQFWEKPDNLLSQNYLVLASRELLWSHTLKPFLPRWQAFGYSYAVVKLQPMLNLGDTILLNKFSFDDVEGWTPLVFLGQDNNKLSWTKEGRGSPGTLIIKAGKSPNNKHWAILPGSIRWQSPALEAKPGFGYRVTGWIKNSEDLEKKFRNGFLRLDFYSQGEKISITNRPLISFVSARVFGKSDWHKVEIQTIAPDEANFVTVGFQADDPSTTFYLDEVEIYQTREKLKMDTVKHYMIKDEDFFNPSDSSFI